MSEFQKVSVYVMISGDYCAFHKASLKVIYDITNGESVGYKDYELESLESWDFQEDGGGYSDVEVRSALKVGDQYYVSI